MVPGYSRILFLIVFMELLFFLQEINIIGFNFGLGLWKDAFEFKTFKISRRTKIKSYDIIYGIIWTDEHPT